jgi:hypothetical protein
LFSREVCKINKNDKDDKKLWRIATHCSYTVRTELFEN